MGTQLAPAPSLDVSVLRKSGVITVPYPDHSILKQEVAAVIPLWKDFCALPQEIKDLFPYTADAKVSGVGYEGPKAGRDPKEDFHLRWSDRDLLYKHMHAIHDPTVTAFVRAGLDLSEHVAPFSAEFAEAFANEFGDDRFIEDIVACKEKALLRFLHYLPGGHAGKVIADHHIDKGGLTAHLFENRSGIEFFTQDRKWEEMLVPRGETTIIGGMRLQHRLRGEINAACHRVVATQETVEHGRYSAVCFVDFHGSPYYDKVSFGTLQDLLAKDPAMFYNMPHDQFDGYFIY